MKDIFEPKELSQKLREIGFDEPCIAIYSIQDNELKGIIQGEEKLIDNFILGKFTCSSYSGIPAPTWEQVFKWFRERGISGYIQYYSDIEKYPCFIKHRMPYSEMVEICETYEQARKILVLEMIERTKLKKKKRQIMLKKTFFPANEIVKNARTLFNLAFLLLCILYLFFFC